MADRNSRGGQKKQVARRPHGNEQRSTHEATAAPSDRSMKEDARRGQQGEQGGYHGQHGRSR